MNTNQATAAAPPLPMPSPIQSADVAAAVAAPTPEFYFSDDGLTIKRLDERELTPIDLNIQRALQVQLLGILQRGRHHETWGIYNPSEHTIDPMLKSYSIKLKDYLHFLSVKICRTCYLGSLSTSTHDTELHQASIKCFYRDLIIIEVLKFLEHILKLESPLNIKNDLITLFSMKISGQSIKYIMFLSQNKLLSLMYDKGPTFEQDVLKLIEAMIKVVDQYELQSKDLSLLVTQTS